MILLFTLFPVHVIDLVLCGLLYNSTTNNLFNGSSVMYSESSSFIFYNHFQLIRVLNVLFGRYIDLEDIMRFMREDEALKTMSLFEGASQSGKISKSALKNWVVRTLW